MAILEKDLEIINSCPHYYSIINTNFDNDDAVTKKLILEFREEIFNISSNNDGTFNRLRVLDLVMNEYAQKGVFYRYTRDYFYNNRNNIDILYDNLLFVLIELFKEYASGIAAKREESNKSSWI